MLKGVDVSNHQGAIDWQAVKDNGIDFAIIRSSWGWFTEDTMFRNNVNGCEAVGIPYGLYHYSYARNLNEAQIEVEGLIRLANSCNPTYPIIIDMEDADNWKRNNGNPSNDMYVQILEYECKKIEEAGYYAMIYANLDWFKNRLNDSRLDRFDKWLAQWYVNEPSMNCGIWQYGANGRVNGINREVDVNYSYNDYVAIIKNMGKVNKPEVPAQPVKPVEYTTYTIQYGDTLNGIAAKYNTTAYELKALNLGLIEDVNKIQAGWTIKVPCNGCLVANNDVNVGDKVKILNAVQYNGQPFKSYYDVYDVIEVSGDRVVIGVNNQVTCAINKNNIVKI